MFSDKHPLLIESIFRLRKWVQENLPIENSLIAYDLILLLSIHNYANGHITIKQLFASLPHSSTAVRSHYQRFIDDGWIEHYPDLLDKRIKYVKPTKKFITVINAYTDSIEEIFITKDQKSV
ncbi:hypothetical protein [Polynucleobacter sp. AP-Feld-500C-C5]|uniref:hypothetical protein n=1 Tax=Polynucleobacter sp. AP-Feld-500C-C5 TaxID=2576924 RepID=UPI001C0D3636|nr:hypothetical protein [Polynucleobacter sp. AP-Feld-500C-C5]MBU3632660.1 hypothetical protein [Polynucleobacter sp. AP-Feld-500C-C5]